MPGRGRACGLNGEAAFDLRLPFLRVPLMVGLNGCCPISASRGGIELGPGLNRDPGSTAEGAAAASRAARASLSACFSPNHVDSAQLEPTVSIAGSISGGGGGGSIEEKSDASPSSDRHVFMLARTRCTNGSTIARAFCDLERPLPVAGNRLADSREQQTGSEFGASPNGNSHVVFDVDLDV